MGKAQSTHIGVTAKTHQPNWKLEDYVVWYLAQAQSKGLSRKELREHLEQSERKFSVETLNLTLARTLKDLMERAIVFRDVFTQRYVVSIYAKDTLWIQWLILKCVARTALRLKGYAVADVIEYLDHKDVREMLPTQSKTWTTEQFDEVMQRLIAQDVVQVFYGRVWEKSVRLPADAEGWSQVYKKLILSHMVDDLGRTYHIDELQRACGDTQGLWQENSLPTVAFGIAMEALEQSYKIGRAEVSRTWWKYLNS